MPLGLPQGIVTFMLGRRSITTGVLRHVGKDEGERAHATFEYPVSKSIKATRRYGLGLGYCNLLLAL
jgi:hypothetical protein